MCGIKQGALFSTDDGFEFAVISENDGNIILTDGRDETLRIFCKITPAFDENNNAVYSLVLTGSYEPHSLDGTYHSFIAPDENGIKSCPSKEELDFVNDIIDCADCGEFSAVAAEFREPDNIEPEICTGTDCSR